MFKYWDPSYSDCRKAVEWGEDSWFIWHDEYASPRDSAEGYLRSKYMGMLETGIEKLFKMVEAIVSDEETQMGEKEYKAMWYLYTKLNNFDLLILDTEEEGK